MVKRLNICPKSYVCWFRRWPAVIRNILLGEHEPPSFSSDSDGSFSVTSLHRIVCRITNHTRALCAHGITDPLHAVNAWLASGYWKIHQLLHEKWEERAEERICLSLENRFHKYSFIFLFIFFLSFWITYNITIKCCPDVSLEWPL